MAGTGLMRRGERKKRKRVGSGKTGDGYLYGAERSAKQAGCHAAIVEAIREATEERDLPLHIPRFLCGKRTGLVAKS